MRNEGLRVALMKSSARRIGELENLLPSVGHRGIANQNSSKLSETGEYPAAMRLGQSDAVRDKIEKKNGISKLDTAKQFLTHKLVLKCKK